MQPPEWIGWCVLRRVARTSLSLQTRLSLVALLVLSVVIVPLFLGLLASSVILRDVVHSAPSGSLPKREDRTALSANLTHLKRAIKSIRQQKRDILLNQLRNQPSAKSVALKLNLFNRTAATGKASEKPQESISHYIQDGIFWSDHVESLRPRGFTPQDDQKWMSQLSRSEVKGVESGCGRMQCRLLTLDTGERVCARYRKNNDQILGEYHSFLLSRLLNISNVPPSALVLFGAKDGVDLQWAHSARAKLKAAQWETKPVVLTKFVDHLNAAYIPSGLRTARRRLFPVPQDIGHLSTGEITELVQWSDLIVLDYLTANLDRMLNNMINERWNPQMMDSPAHNLLHQEESNLLLFLDNESGLFHGYRLLAKYEPLHRSLLDVLCVFRHSTVRQLEKLHQLSEPDFVAQFAHSFRRHTLAHSAQVTLLPKSNLAILRRRMTQVLQQVDRCRVQFGSGQ